MTFYRYHKCNNLSWDCSAFKESGHFSSLFIYDVSLCGHYVSHHDGSLYSQFGVVLSLSVIMLWLFGVIFCLFDLFVVVFYFAYFVALLVVFYLFAYFVSMFWLLCVF